MKKMVPVIIAVLLIVVVAVIGFGGKVLEKYSYGKESADLDAYFGVTNAATGENDGTLAIVLQDDIVAEQAVVKAGTVYFDFDTVLTYFNSNFYVDEIEEKLIYTTANDNIQALFGEKKYEDGAGEYATDYTVCYREGDKLFLAAEYVKKFANFSYEKFDRHLQVYTQWGTAQTMEVSKATQVRVKGGIKSPILRELEIGERVEILEEMEEWSKVKTSDSLIGYVENKRLTDLKTEEETPVTSWVPEEYAVNALDGKVILGWHAIYGVAGNDTLDAMVAEGRGMNVIAPTWFSLTDSEGAYQSFASAKYVEKAHNYGLKVWGVWDDFNYAATNGIKIDTYSLFSSTTMRQQLAWNMVDTAIGLGLDGINLDFERLTGDTKVHFDQFLRELSVLCRHNNLTLAVDTYVPLNTVDASKLEVMGRVSDYVVLMGYDEHWGGCGTAGSVASIGYVSGGIDRTLEYVAAEKIVNALPFYTRLWKTQGTEVTDEAIPLNNLSGFLDRVGKTNAVEWDETTCQHYLEWKSGDTLYQIWLEDPESIKVKLNVMHARDLAGAAVWRLGYGTKEAWDMVAAYSAL